MYLICSIVFYPCIKFTVFINLNLVITIRPLINITAQYLHRIISVKQFCNNKLQLVHGCGTAHVVLQSHTERCNVHNSYSALKIKCRE